MFRSLRGSLLSIGLAGVLATACLLFQALSSFGQLDRSADAAMTGKDAVADVLPPPMYLIELRLVLSEAVEGAVAPAEARKTLDRLVRDYETRVVYWQHKLPTEIEEQLLKAQHATALAFIAAAKEQVLAPLAAGRAEDARKGLEQANVLYRTHRAAVDKTVALASAWADRSIEAFGDARRSGTRWMVGVTLLAATIALAIYVAARRSILQPLLHCADMAHAVASGDLTQRMETTRRDEIGRLQQAIGEMTQQLARMVGDVRGGIDAIASASAQIAIGNHDLSNRTEQQAGRLQQTASSMTVMADTVRSNAERAGDASKLAHGVADVAQRAGDAVGRVVETMGGIRDASRRIADITRLIDDVAFQTNLLALNAAVEAARAGEQGRGFAVVAGEVRALAGRSAEAARQIKSLIEASGERIESGHAMVNDAGRTMDEVCAQVGRVTALLAEIAGAGRAQDSGVREVSDAVVQLDAATQQNAALVEETAAAAESLRVQADRLAQTITVFRLRPA